MNFKRTGKHIFGVEFSKAEQAMIDAEISKQISERFDEAETDIEVQMLWYLHQKHGYGPAGLEKAYEEFSEMIDMVSRYYELSDTDALWACKKKLADIGFDIDEYKRRKHGGDK